jgi:hypothetical protein
VEGSILDIKFSLEDEEFNSQYQETIQKTLRVKKEDVEATASKIAEAGFREYLSMLTEGGMPSRADETKQNRLLYLILFYFQNTLPTESQISTIFQLTQSQSKTLLKNVVSKYRHKIEEILKATMSEVIEQVEFHDGRYLVVIQSDIVRDELDMLITQNEPTYKPITKKRGSAGQYEISEDSYNLLRGKLGIDDKS